MPRDADSGEEVVHLHDYRRLYPIYYQLVVAAKASNEAALGLGTS